MITTVEKIAYGIATAQCLVLPDDYDEKWYRAYTFLSDVIEKECDPEVYGFFKWENLEHLTWPKVLDHIETEKHFIAKQFNKLLLCAKKGIVHSAIECTLDSDLNALDLDFQIKQGAQRSGLEEWINGVHDD
jgi:hypothetical protein